MPSSELPLRLRHWPLASGQETLELELERWSLELAICHIVVHHSAVGNAVSAVRVPGSSAHCRSPGSRPPGTRVASYAS
jgi:hypothetical protein